MHLPVRGGEILLLLEPLLQAHKLQLCEHCPAPSALLGFAAQFGHAALQLAPQVQFQGQVVGGARPALEARAGCKQRGADGGAQAGTRQRAQGELEDRGLLCL